MYEVEGERRRERQNEIKGRKERKKIVKKRWKVKL